MKIGIIGAGYVGATAAYALVMSGIGRDIVLVDLNKERAKAEADDIFHAVPFAHPMNIIAGEYTDLAGAKVVVMAAGVGQKPGETRLQLLERNMGVFEQVIPQIFAHAPDAILVVATNPVDIMTHVSAHIASGMGIPSHRIIGSGTTLDTARFRILLSNHLGVDSTHIHGYVIGEHGDSEVLTWSSTFVGNIPLDEFCEMNQLKLDDEIKQTIDEGTRRAAYRIIEGKGATYYGVGSALAQIIENILSNRRSIMTVCTPSAEVAGVTDVTLSLPRLIGGEGIHDTYHPSLSQQEASDLNKSAMIIRDAISGLGL